jgi:hypothetical protein
LREERKQSENSLGFNVQAVWSGTGPGPSQLGWNRGRYEVLRRRSTMKAKNISVVASPARFDLNCMIMPKFDNNQKISVRVRQYLDSYRKDKFAI